MPAPPLAEVPGEVILLGVGGSRAHGLESETSDYDFRGVYLAPTPAVLGLSAPAESFERHTPDLMAHELGKFAHLALAANPGVLELLYLDEYVSANRWGRMLLGHRRCFLSTKVASSYAGYARARIADLVSCASPERFERLASRAHHALRFLRQGQALLADGRMTVRVADPAEMRSFDRLSAREMAARLEPEFDKLMCLAAKSDLPETPDYDRIDELVIRIRTEALRSRDPLGSLAQTMTGR